MEEVVADELRHPTNPAARTTPLPAEENHKYNNVEFYRSNYNLQSKISVQKSQPKTQTDNNLHIGAENDSRHAMSDKTTLDCNKHTGYKRATQGPHSVVPFEKEKINLYSRDFVMAQLLLRMRGIFPRYLIRYLAEKHKAVPALSLTTPEGVMMTEEILKSVKEKCMTNGVRDVGAEMDELYGPETELDLDKFIDPLMTEDSFSQELFSYETAGEPDCSPVRGTSEVEEVAREYIDKPPGLQGNFTDDIPPQFREMSNKQPEARGLSRLQVVTQIGSSVSTVSVLADTGCNVNLLSYKRYLQMGGEDTMITPAEGASVRNSTETISSPILGWADIRLYVKDEEDQILTLGKFPVMILNTNLEEFLISHTTLTNLHFVWRTEKRARAEILTLDAWDKNGELKRTDLRLNFYWNKKFSNLHWFRAKSGEIKTLTFRYLRNGCQTRVQHEDKNCTVDGSLVTESLVVKRRGFVRLADLYSQVDLEVKFTRPVHYRPGQLTMKGHSQSTSYISPPLQTHTHNCDHLYQPEEDEFVPSGFMEEIYDRVAAAPPHIPPNDKLDLSHLSPQHRAEVEQIETQYAGAFSKDRFDIGHFKLKEFDVTIDPAKVWYGKSRDPNTPLKKQLLQEELDNLEKAGIIEEVAADSARTNLPCFLVAKGGKDSVADKIEGTHHQADSYRLVLDATEWCEASVDHHRPMYPTMEELIIKLEGKKAIISCDLSSAFFCLQYTDQTANQTTFRVLNKAYRFLRAVMGHKSSSRFLDEALRMILNQQTYDAFRAEQKEARYDLLLDAALFIFADDLTIAGESMAEALFLFKYVCAMLERSGLKLGKKKTFICPPSFLVLGLQFYKNKDGSYEYGFPKKRLKKVSKFRLPSCKKALGSRLALVSYFSRVLPWIKSSLAYFYTFLRSNDNVWTGEMTLEWQVFLLALSLELRSSLFSPKKTSLLLVDSSLTATGSCLFQFEDEGNPESRLQLVNCTNKLFTGAETRQSPVHRELIGLIYSLKQNEYFVTASKKTILLTDARCLIYLCRSKNLNESLQNASVYLSQYGDRLSLCHLFGSHNQLADALSRQLTGGILKTTKISKNLAASFPAAMLQEGEILDLAAIERISQAVRPASYVSKNPVPGGKLRTSDLSRLIKETPREHELLRACRHQDYEKINKEHSCWLALSGEPAKKRGYITEAEFRSLLSTQQISALTRELTSFYHNCQNLGFPAVQSRAEYVQYFNQQYEEQLRTGKTDVKYLSRILEVPDSTIQPQPQCLECFTGHLCGSVRHEEITIFQDIESHVIPVTLHPKENGAALIINTAGDEVRPGQTKIYQLDCVVVATRDLDISLNKTKYRGAPRYCTLSSSQSGQTYRLHCLVLQNLSASTIKISGNYTINIEANPHEGEVEAVLVRTGANLVALEEPGDRVVRILKESLSIARGRKYTEENERLVHQAVLKYYQQATPTSHTLRLSYNNGLEPEPEKRGGARRYPEEDEEDLQEDDQPEEEDDEDEETEEEREVMRIALSNLNSLLLFSHLLSNGGKVTLQALLKIQKTDPFIRSLIRKCEESRGRAGAFFLDKHGLLYKERRCLKGQRVYPVVALPDWLVKTLSESLHGSGKIHLSGEGLTKYLLTVCWSKNLKYYSEQSVKSCIACQFASPTRRRGFLGDVRSDISQSTIPGSVIFCDLMENLPCPAEGGFNACVLFIDGASQFLFGYPLRDKKAETILLCLQNVYNITANMRVLYSDGASCFRGITGDWLFSRNIEHVRRSSRPQSNGLSEIYIRLIRELLNKSIFSLSLKDRENWPTALGDVISSYNHQTRDLEIT